MSHRSSSTMKELNYPRIASRKGLWYLQFRFFIFSFAHLCLRASRPLLGRLRASFLIRKYISPLEYRLSNCFIDFTLHCWNHELNGKYPRLRLLDTPPSLRDSFPADYRVSIIIPIYNGFRHLPGLFETLYSGSDLPYDLIIINDASTDPRIKIFLEEWQDAHPEVSMHVLENQKNLGFTASVNKASALAKNDFVWLNTDIILPANWLSRLFYPLVTQRQRIASVYGGSQTVFTYARQTPFGGEIFNKKTVFMMDALASHLHPEDSYVETPISVGYMMAVNHEAYQKIGPFSSLFGKGYGEETEWCLRGLKKGWSHLEAINLYCWHEDAGSFSRKVKEHRIRSSNKIIALLHPDVKGIQLFKSADDRRSLALLEIVFLGMRHFIERQKRLSFQELTAFHEFLSFYQSLLEDRSWKKSEAFFALWSIFPIEADLSTCEEKNWLLLKRKFNLYAYGIQVEELSIPGVVLFSPPVWRDQRGYFLETYNHAISDYLQISFVQENESRSSYGTLRGLHFQKDPWAQAKLVRVLRGRVRDVIVDMRQDSATYGQHLFVDLCEDKQEQLFVPPGCAHGFSVLGEEALFAYKCSKPYFPDHDGGILYCDPELGIPWGLEEKDILVSEKDRKHPSLREYHQEENQEELR